MTVKLLENFIYFSNLFISLRKIHLNECMKYSAENSIICRGALELKIETELDTN